jgi:hypothetical protein
MRQPSTPGTAFGRRKSAEGNDIAVAIACVATAVLLYLLSALVWDLDDDADDGVLVSTRRSPMAQALE